MKMLIIKKEVTSEYFHTYRFDLFISQIVLTAWKYDTNVAEV